MTIKYRGYSIQQVCGEVFRICLDGRPITTVWTLKAADALIDTILDGNCAPRRPL
jgi:hypothetical protein